MSERPPSPSGQRGQGPPAWLLLPALGAIFLAVGLVQVWPQWGLAPNFHPNDDWTAYHLHALDILAHGPALPMVQGVYTLPAGFLYNYFVALCYALAGPRPEAVHLVQSVMLGATVWLLYTAFAPTLSRRARPALLAALVVFALADVQRHYAARLLSENLVLLLVALFFRLLLAGPARTWAPVLALGVLGAIPLTRPNAMIFIPPLLAWLLLSRRGRTLAAPRQVAAGLVLFALVFSAMGLRNHAVTGQWVFFTPASWEMFEVPGYGKGLKEALRGEAPDSPRQGVLPVLGLIARTFIDHPAATTEAYARRLLYCLGFMPLIEPTHQYRPHWMLAWALYLAGLAHALIRRRPLGPAQTALALYLWPMLAVVAGVTWVANYGFRFQLPIILPMLAGAAWGAEEIFGKGEEVGGEPFLRSKKGSPPNPLS